MEDSKTTIEFLRARLLAERSVSQTARQRADELSHRVSPFVEFSLSTQAYSTTNLVIAPNTART